MLSISETDSAFIDFSSVLRPNDDRLDSIVNSHPLNWMNQDIASYAILDRELLTQPLAELSRFLPPLIQYDPDTSKLIVHGGLMELVARELFAHEGRPAGWSSPLRITFRKRSPRSGNTEYSKALSNTIKVITQFLETYEFDKLDVEENILSVAHANFCQGAMFPQPRQLFTLNVAENFVDALRDIVNLESRLC